jgi:hypothetical protein
MRIILATFIFAVAVLPYSLPAYCAISRKDLISYTLDYYAGGQEVEETEQPEPAAAANAEEENKSVTTVNNQGKEAKANIEAEKGEQDINAQEPRPRETRIQKIKRFLNQVHPYAKVKTEYDDNIYLANSNTKEDFIARYDVGLLFEPKTSKKKNLEMFVLGGEKLLKYTHNPKNNTDYPYARAMATYKLDKFRLAALAAVDKTRGAASVLAGDSLNEFIDQWQYIYSSSLAFKARRFESQLQYNHFGYSYKGDWTASNSNKDVLAIRNSLKISPRTKFFLEYAHGWLDYYKNVDNTFTYDKYWVGFEGRFFYKLSGEIKYGYLADNHKVGRHETGNNLGLKLDYKLSPRLILHTEMVNGLGESNLIDNSFVKTRGASLGISYLPLKNKRLRLQTGVSYKEQDSEPDTRDKYFTAYFKPKYQLMKMLALGLDYTFSQKNSNINVNEYIDNNVGLFLETEF